MPMRLVILGSGGYGRTVFDIAEQNDEYDYFVILDDSVPGYELNTFNSYIDPDTCFILAFGNNEFRLSWCDKIKSAGGKLAKLIHPSAYVSPRTVIEDGVVILPKAVVNTGCTVQRGCIVNIGALVDHDCVLEQGVHLAPGAIVKGENRIPACTKVESGEVVERGKYFL